MGNVDGSGVITPTRVHLNAITRMDFGIFIRRVFNQIAPEIEFLQNWHISAIVWHLEQIRFQAISRLIIAMPPRSLKSIAASVALPAWIHGHNPACRIICASYSGELAALLQNQYRSVLRAPWYQATFPATRISPFKNTESEVQLTAGGSRLATSVGGTLTGMGADIIIIDDPLKADEAMSTPKRECVNTWFRSSLLSRLNDKRTGAIVIVSQRVHTDDLIGNVSFGNDDWTMLELPAIADRDRRIVIGNKAEHVFLKGDALHPEREPLGVLERIRREIGSDLFSAQYLQAPVPPGGVMFKRSWVMYYDSPPSDEGGDDQIIQSWDTASKDGPANDWSVCTTWLIKEGNHYLLHVHRARHDYPSLKHIALGLAHQFRPRMILIEDAGVGTALIAELRLAGRSATPVKSTISKSARASVQAATFEGGRVHFPTKAPWLDELQAELFSFPNSRHDDQVDSICQALAYKRNKTVTRTYVRAYDGRIHPI